MTEPTVKELLEKQADTVEALHKSLEKVEGQVKTFGDADFVSKNEVETINAEVGKVTDQLAEAMKKSEELVEAQAKYEKAREDLEKSLHDRIDHIETALKRSPRGADDPDHEVECMKSVEQMFIETQKRKPKNDDELLSLDDFKAYEESFFHYIRKSNDKYGQDLQPEIRKALSVGIEADGGYWVVPVMSNRIITRLFETSPIRSIASVLTISSDAVEFPTDTNSAVSGGWVGEKQTRPETATPEVGEARIPVHEQYAMPKATQKLLDDASFPVETWLADKIADIFMRTENAAFVTGDGVSKPRGFLDYGSDATTDNDEDRNWGILQYVATGDATGFDTGNDPGDEFIDVLHKLKPQFRANTVWVMNRATVAEVRKFKDGQGNYLWSAGDVQRGNPEQLLGHRIVMAEDMPDAGADTFPVAVGDFRQAYQIVDRQGVRTLRDPYTDKPFVLYYTTKRVGADLLNFDAIKLLKCATT